MFKLTIAGIDKKYFEGELDSLTVDLADGQVTILPKHAPLLGNIKKGAKLFVKSSGKKFEFYAPEGGVLEVSSNEVNALLYPSFDN